MKKVEEQEIRRVAEHIGLQADAERVVLFGSYARGEATEHSDVDLLVIAPSDLPRFKRSRALYQSLRPYPFAMDLVVYTPEKMKKAKQSPFPLFLPRYARAKRSMSAETELARQRLCGERDSGRTGGRKPLVWLECP